MCRSIARFLMFACAVALVLSVPTPGSACEFLDRLMPWNWCRGTGSATTYSPVYSPAYATAAPACNPCATQTCSYVPQTSYRTVCRTVPVTTCQAITSCDPCTGCPVTTYRPVTVYQLSAQLIPYTTYRAVWSNPCTTSCTTSCGVVPGAVSYSGTTSGCGAACGGAPAPASSGSTLQPTPDAGATGAPPMTFGGSQGSTNTTYYGNGASVPAREYDVKRQEDVVQPAPVPSPEVEPKSYSKPQELQLDGRTAARPIRQVAYTSTSTGYLEPARMKTTGPADSTGWRSSK
ncbi:MAG: hypothetical protein GX621_07360 [Pirellulaceae bacterium]|nr:hypothetical protein [Pirellulaceae bacterium]